MLRRFPSARANSQKGFYFIVGAVLIAVLLTIVAIIFGLGRITADKARLQAVNNLMAMAAIEAFMDCSSQTEEGMFEGVLGCTDDSYAGKSNAALEAANKFAELNKLQGAVKLLGRLELEKDDGTGGAGGAISFGRWVQEAKDADTCNIYPCFIRNSTACDDLTDVGCGVNAVRVKFNTQPDNPILVPLGKFIHSEAIGINTVSTASVIPRCAAFLLDVSGSSTAETHQRFQNLGPVVDGVQTTDPADPSAFAIRSWPPTADPDTSRFDCSASESENGTHWCSNLLMRKHDDRAGPFNGNKFVHFRSDYKNSNGDDFEEIIVKGASVSRPRIRFDRFVDRDTPNTYEGPEPLVPFLNAFNAGIQQMRRQAVGGDAASVIGFNSGVVTNVVADSAAQLSNNFGFLLQLTNPNNRGTFSWDDDDDEYEDEDDEVRPNFLDAGWYPQFSDPGEVSGTNIYDALEAALSSVSSCPASAKKMIIIATDGIPNCGDLATGFPCSTSFCPDCSQEDVDQWMNDVDRACGPTFKCPDIYPAYMFNEARLLDSSPGSLLSRLIDAKVAVTVLLRGAIVKPNFLTVVSPTTGKAMTQNEARALGYGGRSSEDTGLKFFDYTSGHDSDDFAIKSAATPFLRPNGLMGEIAFKTGGIFCPLQDGPIGSTPYDNVNGVPTLTDDLSKRTLVPETRPLYNLSIGGQATKCIKDAIGGIPFTLVEGIGVPGPVPATPTP